ncbi:hypothetical protein niasHT_018577 [Heterodera trifolii]|uniref:Uncharacterized protein n=1 Tax=Heterodera trifolii TaxID=157864 RepID=A0ABD2LBJ1_9BILA
MPSKKYQSTNSMPRMESYSHININDAVNYAKKTNTPGYQSPYYTPTRSPIKQAKKAINVNNANEMSLNHSEKFSSKQPAEELRQEAEQEEEETPSSLDTKIVLNCNNADQNGQYNEKNTVMDTPKEDCLTLDSPTVFEKKFVEKMMADIRKK